MNLPVRLIAYLGPILVLNSIPARSVAYSANNLFAPGVAQKLDHEIEEIVRQNNLPSVAVGVSAPGKGRYIFVEGFANLQRRTARAIDQPFRVASITKAFAATAILILVDRGLLQKTDPMAKWYPSFPNAAKITIDDLLRMRSGIPAPNDDEVLARVYDNPLAPAPSLADELKSIGQLESKFQPPDTQGVYTDFNYDILASIVQRVTGKDIGDLITESVIIPLKLSNTSYPTDTGIPGPLRGYGWNPATKRFDDKTLFNPPLAGAAGAVVSNISDLLVFSRALCRGDLLKPQTQRARLEGQPLAGTDASYGEGVVYGHGFYGHSGTINGFSTDMYYIKNLDISLVISVNRLDRDNESQSGSIYALVGKTILSAFGSR
jgi:D-alanyl-D-alanine carboxypeptidase